MQTHALSLSLYDLKLQQSVKEPGAVYRELRCLNHTGGAAGGTALPLVRGDLQVGVCICVLCMEALNRI
jgi:hypothetical protein